MRIGTWNVEYARPSRVCALHEVLETNAADLWFLTETDDGLQPAGCRFFAHSDPRPKAENPKMVRSNRRWVSIWSRYPIIDRVELVRADRVRTVAALLDLGAGRTMLAYGTVLPWHCDGKPNWSRHHQVIPEQCSEWRELKTTYPAAEFCIAGDFNSDMGTGSYYGTRQGIAALRAGLAACDMFCATEPARLPPGLLPKLPIDHIALSTQHGSAARIVAAWPDDRRNLSDHSGMIVEIPDRR
jgi:hypothetical protein